MPEVVSIRLFNEEYFNAFRLTRPSSPTETAEAPVERRVDELPGPVVGVVKLDNYFPAAVVSQWLPANLLTRQ